MIPCRKVAQNTQILTILSYNSGSRPQKSPIIAKKRITPSLLTLQQMSNMQIEPFRQSKIQKIQYFILSNLKTQNSLGKIKWDIVKGSLFQVKVLKLNFKETWNGV